MKKYLCISLGILCVVLGSIGVVTPVLPTTPFLLLATFLFSRSSKKLNDLLLKNRIFGKYLSNYFNNTPIPLREKLISISFLWAGLSVTFYFAVLSRIVVIILAAIGVAVSIHIATLGKWRRKKTAPVSRDSGVI
jgi:uncharacterized membrane protein YbaN (DUF454 family)